MANAFKWAEEARLEEEAVRSRVYLRLSLVGLETPTILRTSIVSQKIKVDIEIADDDTVLDLKILLIAALKLPKSVIPILWRKCDEDIKYLCDDTKLLRSLEFSRINIVNFKLVKNNES